MFEAGAHQASGLSGLAQRARPRVVAIASHGDQDAELPLLWDLCSTYNGLGYSVAVIDATTFETEANPGLEHLMDQGYWKDEAGAGQSAWPVIPSGRHLARLVHDERAGMANLEQLTGNLQKYSVVVIYGRPEVLLPLLTGSQIKPVLAVSAARMSRVTAYHALKLLLLSGRLHPTIVAMVGDRAPDSGRLTQDLCRNLQDCAMTFLGYQLDTLTVQFQRPDGGGYSSDMHALALHLLESSTAGSGSTELSGRAHTVRRETSSLAGKH